ncbi:MAG: class I SAM-dependent methyltransferase [Clostridia bacterium]|nr:class I SAM-dependent methyltransferase [Clostridia bacterium]
MFVWSPDAIRFMRDACEYTDFYQKIAAHIAPDLPSCGHVCDAGCGAGYLSLAMRPYVRAVTAVDISAEAIGLLKEKRSDITTLVGNIADLPPATPYDAMVFCFFGGTEEALSWGKAQCKRDGRLILIKKDWLSRRFVTHEVVVERHSALETQRELDARHIPYTLSRLPLEMGQPLASMEDAVRFFSTYKDKDDETPVDEAYIRARLVPDPKGQYAYYLPMEKNVGIFVIENKDIP